MKHLIHICRLALLYVQHVLFPRLLPLVKSPAVMARLCACAAALIAELPYAAAIPSKAAAASAAEECTREDNYKSNLVGSGRIRLEESLEELLAGLAGVMMDGGAELGARIAGELLSKEKIRAAYVARWPLNMIPVNVGIVSGEIDSVL